VILIGQYDSPFVRRVGIALVLGGLEFEQRPLSVFADAAELRRANPLMRVPALVLEDGCVLADSHLILDHIDALVEAPLFPRHEPARHRALRVAGLACGVADKAVSLFYEQRLHALPSPVWEQRCRDQIAAGLAALEAERAGQATPFWFGAGIGNADIAVACAWRFGTEVHPGLFSAPAHPALASFSAALEALPVFRTIFQPFRAPA
jgi:glutathione S-transferase